MARQIMVSWNGSTSTFDMAKVDRSKLYGRRRRVLLDPKGGTCQRAALTEDGSIMVKSGMTAQGYFDPDGHWVPNKELVGLDADGKKMKKIDSTLGKEVELQGPVDPSAVLDLRLQSVYGLDPDDIDSDLEEQLMEGELFQFTFNYRADYQAETAFLMANDEGEIFALIGRLVEPQWRDPEEMIPTFDSAEDDDDDDGDDLDFEMF